MRCNFRKFVACETRRIYYKFELNTKPKLFLKIPIRKNVSMYPENVCVCVCVCV